MAATVNRTNSEVAASQVAAVTSVPTTQPVVGPPPLILPDWLRPVTVQRFAPYRPFTVALVGGTPTPILSKNPMRVGVIFYVPLPAINAIDITTDDGPDGFNLLHVTGGNTVTAMLAEYFSLIMAGLIVTSTADLSLSVVEFARPC